MALNISVFLAARRKDSLLKRDSKFLRPTNPDTLGKAVEEAHGEGYYEEQGKAREAWQSKQYPCQRLSILQGTFSFYCSSFQRQLHILTRDERWW